MTQLISRRVLVASGCGLAAAALSLAPAVAAAPATHARPTVTVRAGSSGVAVSQHVIRPGRVHLRNGGTHPVIVLSALHGSTVSTLIADTAAADSDAGGAAATTKLFHDFAVRAALAPRDDAYLPVSHGVMFIFDASRDTLAAEDVATVRVTAAPAAIAPTPRSPGFRIVVGGAMTPITHSVPRSGYLHVFNGSHHAQVVLLASVKASATAADVRRYLRSPSNPNYMLAVFDVNKPIRDFVFLSSHRGIWAHYKVAVGRHLLMTFDVQDLSGDFLTKHGHVRLLVAD